MATPHSGPYPTGDPNKSTEERDFESALILRAYQRGEPMDEIATRMGLSRSTAYNRLNELISGRVDLTRLTVRLMSYARLEADYYLITKTLEQNDELPIPDLAKLLDARRKLVEAMAKLMGASAPDAQRDDDDDLSDHENWK